MNKKQFVSELLQAMVNYATLQTESVYLPLVKGKLKKKKEANTY